MSVSEPGGESVKDKDEGGVSPSLHKRSAEDCGKPSALPKGILDGRGRFTPFPPLPRKAGDKKSEQREVSALGMRRTRSGPSLGPKRKRSPE